MNILERIERHASELRDDECWTTDLVPNPTNNCTYISDEAPSRAKVRLSRVAWEAHNAQPIPEGMVVCHSCDNPECFNPKHLWIGTQRENIHDAISKKRFPQVGMGKAPHVWTDERLDIVRHLLDLGFFQKDIAELFNTTRYSLRDALKRTQ